jgi:hypothetical protein
MPRAAARRAAASGSGRESANGKGISRAALVLGEVAAQRLVVVVHALAVGHERHDFVFHAEEFVVPVGLHFVDVQARVVVEGQFQRTGDAFMNAQFAQALFVVALLFAGELQIVQLANRSSCRRLEFAAGEDDHAGFALDGDVQESLVIGMALGIPENHGLAVQSAGTAVEHGEAGRVEILQDFALQCIEVQIHVVASVLRQHQNIRGAGEVAGGRCDDRLGPDVYLALLPDGGAHVVFADEIHRFRGRRRGGGLGGRGLYGALRRQSAISSRLASARMPPLRAARKRSTTSADALVTARGAGWEGADSQEQEGPPAAFTGAAPATATPREAR